MAKSLVLLIFFFLAFGFLELTVEAQHCGSLSSKNFKENDLCYPFWSQLSKGNPSATVFVQSSNASVKLQLLASKQRSEGLKVFPKHCRDAAAALSCSALLLPCEYVALPETVPWPSMVALPRPPCYSVCRRMMESCAEYDEVTSLIDCDLVDPSTGWFLNFLYSTTSQANHHKKGLKAFPEEYLEVSLNGISAKIPCMNTTS